MCRFGGNNVGCVLGIVGSCCVPMALTCFGSSHLQVLAWPLRRTLIAEEGTQVVGEETPQVVSSEDIAQTLFRVGRGVEINQVACGFSSPFFGTFRGFPPHSVTVGL